MRKPLLCNELRANSDTALLKPGWLGASSGDGNWLMSLVEKLFCKPTAEDKAAQLRIKSVSSSNHKISGISAGLKIKQTIYNSLMNNTELTYAKAFKSTGYDSQLANDILNLSFDIFKKKIVNCHVMSFFLFMYLVDTPRQSGFGLGPRASCPSPLKLISLTALEPANASDAIDDTENNDRSVVTLSCEGLLNIRQATVNTGVCGGCVVVNLFVPGSTLLLAIFSLNKYNPRFVQQKTRSGLLSVCKQITTRFT